MGAIQTFDINDMISRNQIKAFVETGTLYGDAVAFMTQFDFDEIHSIEIVKDLADRASNRFSLNTKVHIHHGNSQEVLKNLIPSIKTNALYWLDAHFPGVDSRHNKMSDTSDINTKIPLQRELGIISSRTNQFKDVLIIDDLWVYEDCPCESGLFNEHMKKIGIDITRQDLGTTGVQFIYDLFAGTHLITRNYRHQGYLILTPRIPK